MPVLAGQNTPFWPYIVAAKPQPSYVDTKKTGGVSRRNLEKIVLSQLSHGTSAILWLGFPEDWSQDTVSIVNVLQRCTTVDRVSSYEAGGFEGTLELH